MQKKYMRMFDIVHVLHVYCCYEIKQLRDPNTLDLGRIC